MYTNERYFYALELEKRDYTGLGHYLDYKLLFDEDEDSLSYLVDFELLDLCQEEDPTVRAARIILQGDLHNQYDLSTLMRWIQEVDYQLSEYEKETIRQAAYELGNLTNDEMIAQAILNDVALESFAALEGPFDKIKEKLAPLAQKVQQKEVSRMLKKSDRRNSEYPADAAYSNNKTAIKQALVNGGKAFPTKMSEAQILSYYAQTIQMEKDLVPLFALLQDASPLGTDRKSVSLVDTNDQNLITHMNYVSTAMNMGQLGKQQEQQAKQSILAIQNEILKNIKAIKEKNYIISGYITEPAVAQQWAGTSSTNNAATKELTEENKKELIDKWKYLDRDNKMKILNRLIPPPINKGRQALLAYFMSKDSPITDWAFDLVNHQAKNGHDIPAVVANSFLGDPEYAERYQSIFKHRGYEGLALDQGGYTQEALTNQTAAQLYLIRLASRFSGNNYDISNLMEKGGKRWKSVPDMNRAAFEPGGLIDTAKTYAYADPRSSEKMATRAEEYRRQVDLISGGSAMSGDTTFQDSLKNWFKTLPDKEFVQLWEGLRKDGSIVLRTDQSSEPPQPTTSKGKKK